MDAPITVRDLLAISGISFVFWSLSISVLYCFGFTSTGTREQSCASAWQSSIEDVPSYHPFSCLQSITTRKSSFFGITCVLVSVVCWFSFKDSWPYFLKALDISLLELGSIVLNIVAKLLPIFIFYSNELFAFVLTFQWYYILSAALLFTVVVLLGCSCLCVSCCARCSERRHEQQGYITLNDLSSRNV